MKLIIDIPDKDYEKLKDGHIPFSILDVMRNGTPISNGITRKELHHLLFHINPPELDSPYMSCANANGGKGCESCKHKDDLDCDKNWWNAPWEGGERMSFCIRPSVCKKCGKPLTLFEGWHCLECEAKIEALEQEPKTGHWIGDNQAFYIYAKCSECGSVHDTATNY